MFPLVINLRVLSSAAPNEDGKFAVLFAAGLVMAIAAFSSSLVPRRSLKLELHAPGLLLLLFLAILAAAVIWTPNRTDGLVRLAVWACGCLCFLAAVVGARNSRTWLGWFHRSSVASASAFSFVFFFDYFRYFLSASRDPWVLFSPIGHVNFTGDVLVVWLPLLLWTACERELPRLLRLAAWLCGISFGAILCLGASRSALGGLGAGALLVSLFLAWRMTRGWKAALAPSVAVLGALLLGLLLYLLLPMPFRPLDRLTNTLEGRSAQFWPATTDPEPAHEGPAPPLARLWRSPWMAGRLGPRVPIYAASCAMIADAPLAGHGTGSFRSVYPAYARRFPGFRDPLSAQGSYATNPHNVVLQIATESGLPAALVFLLLYAWMAARAAAGALSGRLGAASAFAAWGVASGLFCAVFSHTFFNPASLFVMAIASGILWAQCGRGGRVLWVMKAKHAARPLLAGLVLALLLAVPATRWLMSQHHLGVALAQAPGSEKGRESHARALEWNPHCDRAALGLGTHSMLTLHPARAARQVEELLEYHPHSAAAYRTLALAGMRLGERARTRWALGELLRLRPGDEQARNLLAHLAALELEQENRVSSEDPTER